MWTINKTARVAGLLYLCIVFLGIFYLRYIPSQLIVPGDDSATLTNISNHETIFRLGILAEVVADIVFLLLSFVLYKLFSQVNKTHAVLMVTFVALAIPISFIDLSNKLSFLTVMSKPEYLAALPPANLKAQALLYLDLYDNGNVLAQIFWGLWLFPLGYLILKSGFVPKVLGLLLIIGCLGYLVNFTGCLLSPHYPDLHIGRYVTLPASLGELCTCLWLLIFGAKENIKKLY